MSVPHLTSSRGCYGAENVVINLARLPPQFGFSCALGVFTNRAAAPEEILRRARENGLRAAQFQCRGRIDSRAPGLIRKFAWEHQIDIVHTHGYKADCYAYAALRDEPPLVATCHGWTSRSRLLHLYEKLDRKVLKRFQEVIAVPGEIGSILCRAGVPENRVTIVENGIDASPLAGAEPTLAHELGKGTRLMVGTVGRLPVEKGPKYSIRSALRVLTEFPEALFVFVGDGPEREGLQGGLARHRIEDRVILAGRREKMPGVYASFDVFVLPSISEGLPVALLEAMASSRPAIATRVGAVPETIRHEENGLLVEPGDVLGLARSISMLLRDASLRHRLAARARAAVEEQFSARAMASKYSDAYGKILAAARNPKKPEMRAHVA